MASDTRSAWHRIQDGIRDTERLITQDEYNLAMIKARQTLEIIIKQLSGKSDDGEQSLADIIDSLYTDNIISKMSCEHYHKIRALGNKAVHENDNDAYSANVAYSLLSEEVQTFIHDYSPKRNKTTSLITPVRIKNNHAAKSKTMASTDKHVIRKGSRRKSSVNISDLTKVVVGFLVLIILIFLFKALNPLKKNPGKLTVDLSTSQESSSDSENSSDITESAAYTTYVTTARLNVRSAPSRDGDILETLNKGVTVEYIKEHDSEWSVINYNGGEAYVATRYINPAQ